LYEDAGGSMNTRFNGSKCVAGQMFEHFKARQLLREFSAIKINCMTEEIISNFFVSRLKTKLSFEPQKENLKPIGKFKFEKLSVAR
jgi:hypothetical protein